MPLNPQPSTDSIAKAEARNRYRRKNRCFHRVISGLEKKGSYRFITLTSSPDSPLDIQRSFRKLIMRLRRRRLVDDYIKVRELTESGLLHLHIIYRGAFIPHHLLSSMWSKIHGAPVVDIRQVRTNPRGKRKVASYLASDMAKQGARNYSWSWGWVYKGFVAVWKEALRMIREADHTPPYLIQFHNFLKLWHAHLRGGLEPEIFLEFLEGQIWLSLQSRHLQRIVVAPLR